METKHCKYCNEDKSLNRFTKGRAKCMECLAADKRRINKGILLDKEDSLSKPCVTCGVERGSTEFHPKKNSCMRCHKEYMKEYRESNKDKISKQVGDWKTNNRDKVNQSARNRYSTEDGKMLHEARVLRTWRSWMSHIISALSSHSKKPGKRDPKSGPKREFDIDLDYVVKLIEDQGEKCAVTGIKMTIERNSLFAASIDRIDSKLGHIKGNIQIVCQAVNWAKRHHDNDRVVEFFDAYFNSRLQRESSP